MNLSQQFINRCRHTLLKCEEFSDINSLRSVFKSNELNKYSYQLPRATNPSDQVNKTISYLLSKKLSDGRPVFPLFMAALRDQQIKGDALHDELVKRCNELGRLAVKTRPRTESEIASTPPPLKHQAFICSQEPARIAEKFKDVGYICTELNTSIARRANFAQSIINNTEMLCDFLFVYISSEMILDSSLYIRLTDTEPKTVRSTSYNFEEGLSKLFNSEARGVFIITNLICDSVAEQEKIRAHIKNLLSNDKIDKYRPRRFVVMNIELRNARLFEEKLRKAIKKDLVKMKVREFADKLVIDEHFTFGIRHGRNVPLFRTATIENPPPLNESERYFLERMDESMRKNLRKVRDATYRIHQDPLDIAAPEYGFERSRRIIDQLHYIWSSSKSKLEHLESEDIFVLIASAYLQYIGKQIPNYTLEESRTIDYQITINPIAFITRNNHIIGIELPSTSTDKMLKLFEFIRYDKKIKFEMHNQIHLIANLLKIADLMTLDQKNYNKIILEDLYSADYKTALYNFALNHIQKIHFYFREKKIFIAYIVNDNKYLEKHINAFMQCIIDDYINKYSYFLEINNIYHTEEEVEYINDNFVENIPSRIHQEIIRIIISNFQKQIHKKSNAIGLHKYYYNYTSQYDTKSQIFNQNRVAIRNLTRKIEGIEMDIPEKYTRKAMDVIGFMPIDYLEVALFNLLIGEEDKAIKYYEKVINSETKSHDKDLMARAYYGLHHVFLGKSQRLNSDVSVKEQYKRKALEYYREAIKHNPRLAVFPSKFRVKSIIGRGGVGVVYKVEDTSNNNKAFAMKVLHMTTLGNSSAISQLEREIKILTKLNYVGIVKVFNSVIKNSKFPYLQMQFIQGNNLEEIMQLSLSDQNVLPLERIFLILTKICNALSYAHQKHVVHKDIKPSNIIVNGDNVKIIDFGLAFMLEAMIPTETKTSTIFTSIGTFEYMAPEMKNMDLKQKWKKSFEDFRYLVKQLEKQDGRNQLEIKRELISCLAAFYEVSTKKDRILLQKIGIRNKGQLFSMLSQQEAFSNYYEVAKSLLINKEKEILRKLKHQNFQSFVKITAFRLKQRMDVYSLGHMARQLLTVNESDSKLVSGEVLNKWIVPATTDDPSQRIPDIPTFVVVMISALKAEAENLEKQNKFKDAELLWNCIVKICMSLDYQVVKHDNLLTLEKAKGLRNQSNKRKKELNRLLGEIDLLKRDPSSIDLDRFLKIQEQINQIAPNAEEIRSTLTGLFSRYYENMVEEKKKLNAENNKISKQLNEAQNLRNDMQEKIEDLQSKLSSPLITNTPSTEVRKIEQELRRYKQAVKEKELEISNLKHQKNTIDRASIPSGTGVEMLFFLTFIIFAIIFFIIYTFA